ncbi:hypothetical protein Lfu02_49470 [Longispora fulva]|uniref:Uncharacterized protein n=1 Tax=Longispora fulva TaxID=619741 RepID=A0A8J7GK63_9ACTN|nr:hypothetical protein [Longispora fulva]MBG6138322.1 hypothetical protein [Longispora fulva]GIG60575.1 hypothetical protein Lfu02_49470 [Longispora fulva]
MVTVTAPRWFRDRFRDAVWESEQLTADHKAVAETYARHARDAHGDKSAAADLAWLTYDRVQVGAGIRRRSNVKKILDDLEAGGWLVVVQRVHRRPTVYRLTIPTSRAADGENATTVVPPDVTTVVPRPVPGRNHRSHNYADQARAGSPDVGTPPLEELPSISSPSADAVRPADIRRVIDATGADEHQAAAIIAKIRNENQIRSVSAYLRAISDADLRLHHAALHGHGDQAGGDLAAAFERRRSAAPDCIHGYPAGALIHPTTGRAMCPLCRRGRPALTPSHGRPGD